MTISRARLHRPTRVETLNARANLINAITGLVKAVTALIATLGALWTVVAPFLGP